MTESKGRPRSYGATAALALASATVAAGCSGPSARTHDVTAPSASASSAEGVAPTSSAAELSFEPVLVEEPKVDGDLEEWLGRSEEIDHVAVHVSDKGVYLAGQLDPGYARGVLFTVASPVAPLPVVGEPTRGGGHQEFDCVHERDYFDGNVTTSDRPLKADIAAQCRAYVAAFDKQKADHAARFVKHLAVDEKGLVAVDEKGARSAIGGAKAVWKASPEGAIVFEAFLPSSGMPRLAESPLTSLFVLGSAASSGAAPQITEASPLLPLAVPILYEPNGTLRTTLYAMYSTPHYVAEQYVETAGMSYLASDPAHVETWRHEGSGERISASNDALFVSALKVGDVEVGHTNVHSTYVSIFKAGELGDVVAPPGDARKILERDGEIHVIGYADQHFGMMGGHYDPSWQVMIIDKDGTPREVIEDGFWQAKAAAKCSEEMDPIIDGVASSSAAWDELVWTGSCRTGDPGTKQGEAGFQVSYKWDSKKATYVASHKLIPVSKTRPKPGP